MQLFLVNRFAAAVALLAATACVPGSGARDRPSPRAATFVDVTNSSWYDVVVYAVGTGPRWRLGMVNSLDTETLLIPAQLLAASELRLLADPIGPRDVFVSERIVLSPGQRVELMLTPRLAQSYHALRW